MRYKALLVGLGRIGCGYDAHLPFLPDKPESSPRTLTHARALVCHPGFELVAGVDPDPMARERFSGLYGLPSYADLAEWRSVSGGLNPELIVIGVPPQLQPVLLHSLLGIASPRVLLLEKPLAASLADAIAVERRCSQEVDLQVAVNYIRRYLPSVLAWQQRLETGELGRFLHGQITYGKGLLNNGSHFVNLAEAWLGPLQFSRLIDPGSSCFGFDREASIELRAENHADAPVTVRSIGSAELRAGEVDLWFEGGRLCWLNHGQAIAFWPRVPPEIGDSYSPLTHTPEIIPSSIEHYQLEVFNTLHNMLIDPLIAPSCSLAAAVQTLKALYPALNG